MSVLCTSVDRFYLYSDRTIPQRLDLLSQILVERFALFGVYRVGFAEYM